MSSSLLEKRSAILEKDTVINTRKRLFAGLILSTCSLALLTLVLFWAISYIGLRNLHPIASFLLGGIFSLLSLTAILTWLGLIFDVHFSRPTLFPKRLYVLTIKSLLPLAILLASFVGISKKHIRNSFIKVNNELIKCAQHRYSADKILLLMPHCLQNSQCSIRLTYNIHHCKRCGKCPVTELRNLSEEFGVHLAIATGGTIARRIVVNIRPQLIIAVACERDLASGIQDAYPIPVYGVLNERPNGPCLDTLVPTARLREALKLFLDCNTIPT